MHADIFGGKEYAAEDRHGRPQRPGSKVPIGVYGKGVSPDAFRQAPSGLKPLPQLQSSTMDQKRRTTSIP